MVLRLDHNDATLLQFVHKSSQKFVKYELRKKKNGGQLTVSSSDPNWGSKSHRVLPVKARVP